MQLFFARTAAGFIAIAVASLFWIATGCSGSGGVHSSTLEGNLLQYNKVDLVTIGISGRAACDSCGAKADITGLLVEISLKNDPTSMIAMDTFDGLGSFSFPEIRVPKGAQLLVSGTLYLAGEPESAALEATEEVSAPDDDGKVSAVILNF